MDFDFEKNTPRAYRRFRALPITPVSATTARRRFAMAFTKGMGGIVVADYCGEPAIYYNSRKIGLLKNRRIFQETAQRAWAKYWNNPSYR